MRSTGGGSGGSAGGGSGGAEKMAPVSKDLAGAAKEHLKDINSKQR